MKQFCVLSNPNVSVFTLTDDFKMNDTSVGTVTDEPQKAGGERARPSLAAGIHLSTWRGGYMATAP